MLIAFATDPGKTATDEGVYAQALTEEMQKPGVLATEVFRAVRSRVLAATENRQFPWIEDGLIDNMYFKPPSLAQQAALPGETPPIRANEATALTPSDITVIATLGSRADDKEKAALGVQARNWEKAWSSAFKAEGWEGAFVVKTLDRSAAEAAGIRPFDVITALDGEPIDSGERLTAAIGLKKPGGKVEVRLRRLAGNRSTLIEHLKKGVEHNDLGAIKLLASANRYVFATPQALNDAAQLYRKAADLGNTTAIRNLGWMYNHGEGIAQDKAEAARLYRKAADLGNADAMYGLGLMYDNGERVEQNRQRAAELVIAAIKKQNDFTLKEAPFDKWSVPFRKELEQLLKAEGVYNGRVDGRASEALRDAVLALAAKSKSGG